MTKRFDLNNYQNDYSLNDLVIIYQPHKPCPAMRVDEAVVLLGGWSKFFELNRLGGLKIIFNEQPAPEYGYAYDFIEAILANQYEVEFDGITLTDAAKIHALSIRGDQSQIIY